MPDIDPAVADQLRRAALAVRDMRQKLEAEQARSHAPIAIVGMGCRFPGAPDLSAYWDLLQSGGDAITKVPAARWDIETLYDPDPDAPGKMSTQWGGFIEEVETFDAEFFEISPREARSMDPQHRLLLQTSWRAFEDAGLPIDRLPKSKTGVYVGISTNDYSTVLSDRSGADWIDAHASLGNSVAVAAGRLSYFYGLQGPAVSVDTACSSSLVALHQAVRALRWGEIDLGLAAGVNLCLTPELTIGFSKARMMAADGRCKTFDANADGYVRGEGCGVILLKRLDDALRDGDRIRAVVLGSAVNQDGRSNGLTAPNGPAQTAVIRAALADAQKMPGDVTMIEAHGTGTALGDPVEVGALGAVFQNETDHAPFLASVKTNIGHLEAAAGIAGVIKSALALEHRQVPAHLHFRDLNPMIDAAHFPFKIPTSATVLPDGTPPIAGVSSFGFSGTNAHVILSAPPEAPPVVVPDGQGLPVTLALSAHSKEALAILREKVVQDVQAGVDLLRYANMLASGRTPFRQRLAITAKNTDQTLEALQKAESVTAPEDARIGFLFTGQGSQYASMAAGLMTEPSFHQTIARCDEVLDGLVGRSLRGGDLLSGRTDLVQPLLVALEYAIADLWRARGVMPTAVIGHSVGEIAAAAFAGAMTLEDALRFVAERGRLMERCAGLGSMAAALAPSDQVARLIEGTGAVIAGYNAPANTVISGTSDALAKASAKLEANDILLHPLEVATAFHSPVLDPILDEIATAAAQITPGRANIPVFSNLTGEPFDQFDASYWRAQAAAPVRFMDGLQHMVNMGLDLFLEVGPHPVLAGLGSRILPEARFVASLKRGMDDRTTLAEATTSLFLAGVPLDLGVCTGPRHVMDVPTHPLRQDRHWPDPANALALQPAFLPVSQAHFGAATNPSKSLMGQRLDTAAGPPLWQSSMDTQTLPFLADHVVFGEVVVPGAMLAVMGVMAANGAIEDLVFEAPLQVPETGVTVQISVTDETLEIYGKGPGGDWLRHSAAQIPTLSSPDKEEVLDLAALEHSLIEDKTFAATFYDDLAARGIDLGPDFRGISRLWRGDGAAMAEIRQPDSGALGAPIHPAALDACFQILGATFTSSEDDAVGGFLPLSVDRVVLDHQVPNLFRCHATILSQPGSSVAVGHFRLSDLSGRVLGRVDGLQIKRVTAPAASDPVAEMMLGVDWIESPEPLPNWADPARLSDDLKAHRAGLAALPETGLSEALDALAASHATRAVQVVGRDEVGAGFVRLYESLHILAERGGAISADEWREKFPDNHAEINLVDRCGAALADVLRGRRNGVDVLDLGAGSVYSGAGLAERANALAAQAIASAAQARGIDRLRILEVGAGTGATTRAVLDALPDTIALDYVFSDISDGFLKAAAQTFANPSIRFSRFDLERDPSLQGLRHGSFDMILAANVVHATRDIAGSLGALHQLLTPGGLLVLVESTQRQDWWDIVFGLTEGWWAFEDTDLRPDHALLTVPDWKTVLTKTGFSAVAGIGADSKARQSILLASAGPTTPVLLVHDGKAGQGRQMALAVTDILISRGWQAEALTTNAALERIETLDACDVLYTGGLSSCSETALKAAFDLSRARAAGGTGAIGFATGALYSDVSGRGMKTEGAVLSGFAKVLAQEHGDLGAQCIDVDPQDPEAAVQLANAVATLHSRDREIRWTGDERQVARLVQKGLPPVAALQCDDGARYLITGAFGGLGRTLAAWLADRGARHLILTGRRLPDPEVQAELRGLAQTVELHRLDATDRAGLREIIGEGIDLKGVFHLAGSVADGAILSQDWARFASILPAKIAGAQLLDELTRDLVLDHFVLFSTSAALIGNPGQSNHAAANAMLDALARDRQNAGLPGLSVNWGAFDQAGAVVDRGQVGQMATRGVRAMPLEQGFEAMERAMVAGVSNLGVVSLDWPAFMAGLNDDLPPFLENFRQIEPLNAIRPGASSNIDVVHFGAALAELPPEARSDGLADLIAAEAAAVLGMASAQQIDRDQALNELGLDSLLALELRNRLGAATGKKRSATLLFDHPSVGALALHLGHELLEDLPTGPSAQEALQQRFEAEVQAMSDADIEAMLDAEFGEATGQ